MRLCLALPARELALSKASSVVDTFLVPMQLADRSTTAELSAAKRDIAEEDPLVGATLVVTLV